MYQQQKPLEFDSNGNPIKSKPVEFDASGNPITTSSSIPPIKAPVQAETPKPGFFESAWNTGKGIVKGMYDLATTGDPMEKGINLIAGNVGAVGNQVIKGNEAGQRGGVLDRIEQAGRYASIPFEIAGIPVGQAGDALGSGDFGKGAVLTGASILGGLGTVKGVRDLIGAKNTFFNPPKSVAPPITRPSIPTSVPEVKPPVELPQSWQALSKPEIQTPSLKVKAPEQTVLKPVSQPLQKPKLDFGDGQSTEVILKNPTKDTIAAVKGMGYEILGTKDGQSILKKVKNPQVLPEISRPNQKIVESTIEGKIQAPSEVVPPKPPDTIWPQIEEGELPEVPKKSNLASDILALPRGLKSAIDASAPRQGIGLAGSKEYWTSFDDMFKAMKSEEGSIKVQSEVESHPRYAIAKEHGLKFAELSDVIGNREEGSQATLLEKVNKIPGVGKIFDKLGNPFRASNRGYAAFLNKLRMDSFGNLLDRFEDVSPGWIDNETNVKALTDYINTFTGRGSLKGKVTFLGEKSAEGAAPFLNSVLFSPRLLSSRMKMLASPVTYWSAPPEVRREAFKSLLKLGGLGSATLGLIQGSNKLGLTDAKVGTDPDSSDFGKVRIGNNHVDMWGGLQQPIVLSARLMHGQYTDASGKTREYQPEKFGGAGKGDTINNFLASKNSPLYAMFRHLVKGIDDTGRPITVGKETESLLAPMFLDDMVHLMMDDPKLIPILGGPAFLGAGLQTYENKPIKKLPIKR